MTALTYLRRIALAFKSGQPIWLVPSAVVILIFALIQLNWPVGKPIEVNGRVEGCSAQFKRGAANATTSCTYVLEDGNTVVRERITPLESGTKVRFLRYDRQLGGYQYVLHQTSGTADFTAQAPWPPAGLYAAPATKPKGDGD